ncbi:MAG: hypothetical protein FJY92_05885 [Candidatus Hydrogenedentes bacterium]|nr:hypothetical protein [Candidatus Hydrogenedentota bacterium]
MNTARNDVFREALALGEDDRIQLAGLLLEKADGPADPGWEDAWRREIERRAEELESGAVVAVPWAEVRERLMRKLDANPPR